jgi:hypothetical protein
VRYRRAATRVVTITNPGKVFVHFRVFGHEPPAACFPDGSKQGSAGGGDSSKNGRGGGGGGGGIPLLPGEDWLSVEPSFGLLMPGEARKMLVTVEVRDAAARRLRHGHTPLDRTLVVQVVAPKPDTRHPTPEPQSRNAQP